MKQLLKALIAFNTALVIVPPTLNTLSYSVATIQAQQQKLLSLGGSLTPQQQELTKNLLGANGVNPLMVTGDVINQYLHDGSNAGTTVYSSAYIEKQAAGYGVQVQIVTPQNITVVSPTTYQNAAITSGAKDVLIKIATVSPVTGEGALAGVYALLAQSGVKVDQNAVQAAEKEVKTVTVIKQENQLTDTQINQIISEIKKEVTTQIAQNNGTVNNQQAQTIVNNVVNNITNNNTTINISDDAKKELAEVAEQFAKTDAAKDTETIKQLEQSVDNSLNAPWKEVLQSVTEGKSVEELLKSKDDVLAKVTNPVIKALFVKFYEQLANSANAFIDVYAHTFVLEKLMPTMSPEDKQALNQLRVLIVQAQLESEKNMAGLNGFKPITQRYLDLLTYTERLNNDPVQKAIIDKVAVATGYGSEVAYVEFNSQKDDEIILHLTTDQIDHTATLLWAKYNVKTGAVSTGIEPTWTAVSPVLDFAGLYGVGVQATYEPSMVVPSDYRLPNAETTSTAQTTEVKARYTSQDFPGYTDQEVLAAQVWASAIDEDIPFSLYTFAAGTPINSYIPGGSVYPVTIYSISDTVNSMEELRHASYADNGDGTVTLYQLPTHWHMSTLEESEKVIQEVFANGQTLTLKQLTHDELAAVLAQLQK